MDSQPRRRRRPALSCVPCRRRKIKCDRNDPCGHCVSARTECVYRTYSAQPSVQQQHPSHASTPSPSASIALPFIRVHPLKTHRTTPPLEPALQIGEAPAARTDSSNTPFRSIRASSHTQGSNSSLRLLSQKTQNVTQPLTPGSVNAPSETARDLLTRQSGLQDSQVILNKTRIVRWSHWMGTAEEVTLELRSIATASILILPEFSLIGACYAAAYGYDKEPSFQDPEIQPLVIDIGHLLQKCKIMAKSIKGERPSRSLQGPDSGLTPPARDLADAMTTLYFQSFESTYRILHEPSFWIDYQRYWSHPNSVPTDVRLKILLVIAIGSSLGEYGDADAAFRHMVHQWIYAAQVWLSGPLEKNRLTMAGLQVHCLTILARQTLSIGGDLIWASMGSLTHRAMQMGLHRDPKHIKTMSLLQAEVRRRLWATILEMIVQSSLDSAMPPRISPDDFDTEAPSNYNDNDIEESTAVLEPHPANTYTSTSIQLLLLGSVPVRLRIVQLLNGLHTELSYSNVLELSTELTSIYQKYGRFLRENDTSGVTPFRRNLLDYFVRRFMIPLHCPFASQARTNPLFHYSLKASLDAAMAILSPEPDTNFSNLMAIGGGMFREGIWYAATIVTLELIAQTEAQRLDGTLHRNSQQRDVLKQAVRNLITLSTERIQKGETNIKSHMFLSMILAQTEAVEASASCELGIAQSAKESLEFCQSLLQRQIDALSLPNFGDNFMSINFEDGQESSALDFDLDSFLSDAGFA